ncbi:hypothetical protein W97_05983 [Coniosporium apollinis CBS 100218]|uniref:Fungal lipase-type domain-containing protein n=1 Tax=Coniosporium apollinis (strain CBS 100218) TaxID=1168221 RepID=R7YXV5_CONA1|nr:uncharacterized protein W97_05983 [Coniosporium apollinis CBS 100218]EON66737.1 hypothetical protein W97_05983 [Coniosporium apollinis CBS 100218]
MRLGRISTSFLCLLTASSGLPTAQVPLLHDEDTGNRSISVKLFAGLEELARIVDISYCVGATGLGIHKPFQCLSRCSEFENFELVTTWNTGPLLSDSCGYIALSHPPSAPRIILAFRGTYSIANTIADLSTLPQEYLPYPGGDDTSHDQASLLDKALDSLHVSKRGASHSTADKCTNCTVHSGFYRSWLNTRSKILADLAQARAAYPSYTLTLVGHSLGGAVATLAALDFDARGWEPHVTTFGEPRVGNEHLMRYIDSHLVEPPNGTAAATDSNPAKRRFRRVTHAGDPIPLLPLEEWGYHMHAGEIFIGKANLPPSVADLEYCNGDEDPECIAGGGTGTAVQPAAWPWEKDGGWSVPARYKLWQLFFAHRDYFWRLGLCVPGGDPRDWYRKYPRYDDGDEL